MIEKLEPHWAEPGRREYHGMTRGWVANEVFRRMDPGGRTIGQYLAEDVAQLKEELAKLDESVLEEEE